MSTSTAPRLEIVPEDTPNPLSHKFTLNRTLLQGRGRDFASLDSASASVLAQEMFRLPGVKGIYVGENFVTVSVNPGSDWWTLHPLIIQTLETFVGSGAPMFEETNGSGASAAEAPKFSVIEAGIIRVLENEIQPAVAMDGGHIAFVGYENGIVRVQLRGACHSCPSSTVTLKMGIETRLKQEFPEIVAVEAV